ncbi:MAG TPA: HAMP domain-containing sensor histidine kinase [Actinomycetota bacterium]|nr:HAMP domain-containing sensor histidine kinase [Actinomycetota bacterium]
MDQTTSTEATDGTAPRIRWGIRSRILIWFIAVLSAATVAAILVTRQILIASADARIEEALQQEGRELRALAGGRDPTTGEPFGNQVHRIFEVFLQRNLPVRNEMFMTFLDGEPHEQSVGTPIYPLDRDLELIDRFGAVTRTERGQVPTPAGDVEYLAVPVRANRQIRGVFVAAIFREEELADLAPALWGAVGVGLVTLLVGSVLAWRVAEGVLRPVAAVTDTAASISTTELTRRIDVQGHDEVSHLGATFNDMLDRLEDAFLVQRQFVDDAGHELRTPITIIRGQLETLEHEPDDREQTVDLVIDELDRMNRIVNDLLLLAKAEQPDFLDLDTVDVSSLTEELHAKARALGPRAWDLETTGRGVIVADRQRLTQAMMQLAQNATDHTIEGDRIALGSSVENGVARLWVSDSGRGIPKEEQEQIFRRFARSGNGRPSSSPGAGLGLAIVRAIAEAHHGTVDLRSEPGEGATFTLLVPVDQPVPEPTES